MFKPQPVLAGWQKGEEFPGCTVYAGCAAKRIDISVREIRLERFFRSYL
jgi:hypothetical protein